MFVQCCGCAHTRCAVASGTYSDRNAVVVQLKQEVGELSQAERREKRQGQKLQLELLQAKQLLEKLHGKQQVPQHYPLCFWVLGPSLMTLGRVTIWL